MAGFTDKQKRLIVERDGVCVPHGGLCGTPEEYLVCHHRANRGHGGFKAANHVANGLAVCGAWNSDAEAFEPLMRQAYDNGWKLRRYEVPSDSPVYYPHIGDWFELDDDGFKYLSEGRDAA